MLFEAVWAHGPTQIAVRNLYDWHLAEDKCKREAEKALVVDFSAEGDRAEYVLNDKYESASGSKEYDSAWNATADFQRIIKRILERAQPSASYGTRKSALETLCFIGECIIEAPSSLGSEVRMHLECEIPNGMECILLGMTIQERVELANSEYEEGGTFLDQLYALHNNASSYVMWRDELPRVLHLLRDYEPGEESATEDGDGEEKRDQE